MEESTHPTKQQYEFLRLAYIRFEEIWQIYIKEDFYDQPAEYRHSTLKEAFGIYSEVTAYKPLISYLTGIESNQDKLWLFFNVEIPEVVWNILLHFPFSRWEDVYINKSLVTLNEVNSTIDKFFEKYKGYEPIICTTKTKRNIFNEVKINFPPQYDYLTNIYLKDIIDEEAGVDLFLTLMKSAMFSQLKSLEESLHHKPEVVTALKNLLKNYEAIQSIDIDKSSSKITLGKNAHKCRFCGKDATQVTFNNKAHAIPELIGNKTLLTQWECDMCNSKFGGLLETHFGNFMLPYHSVWGIRGKNGYPKFKGRDGTSFITVEKVLNGNGVNDDSFDQETNTITVVEKIPSFIPVAVYKCLVKMAITIMPNEEMDSFEKTLSWINETTHTNSSFVFEHLWLLFGTLESIERFPQISTILLKRLEQSDPKLPYIIFRLTYGIFIFQIPLPLCTKDSFHIKDCRDIPYIPHLMDLRYGFDKTKLDALDFKSCELSRGWELSLKFENAQKVNS